jgi:hypothetical protein
MGNSRPGWIRTARPILLFLKREGPTSSPRARCHSDRRGPLADALSPCGCSAGPSGNPSVIARYHLLHARPPYWQPGPARQSLNICASLIISRQSAGPRPVTARARFLPFSGARTWRVSPRPRQQKCRAWRSARSRGLRGIRCGALATSRPYRGPRSGSPVPPLFPIFATTAELVREREGGESASSRPVLSSGALGLHGSGWVVIATTPLGIARLRPGNFSPSRSFRRGPHPLRGLSTTPRTRRYESPFCAR